MPKLLPKLKHRHVKKQDFVFFPILFPYMDPNFLTLKFYFYFVLKIAESVTNTPRLTFKPTNSSTNGSFFKQQITEIHFQQLCTKIWSDE